MTIFWVVVSLVIIFGMVAGAILRFKKSIPPTKVKVTPKTAFTKRCPNGHKNSIAQLQNCCTQCGARMVKVEVPACCACGERRFGGDDYCANCGAKFFEEYKEE